MSTVEPTGTVLDDIIVGVLADLAQREAAVPLAEMVERAAAAPPALDPLPGFRHDGLSVIAEVKRASPSKGALAGIAEPAELATRYAEGGASAISVLTEQRRFAGSLTDLDAVRNAVALPVLRKDFVVTEYQLYETRAHGADLALLIVAALDEHRLGRLYELSLQLGLTPLVEVHTPDEAKRATDLGAQLVGVNNRNLKTLSVDLSMFARIVPHLDPGIVKVAESGILRPADAASVRAAGADVILVGEALVTNADPSGAISRLIDAAAAQKRPRIEDAR